MLEFVMTNPTRPLDEPTVRWILEHLGGATGNVLDARADDGHGLVACLLPAGRDNEGADLFVMGYRPRTPVPDVAGRAAATADAIGAELGEALRWAEARARERGAKWLEVTLAPALAAARPILRERGWPLVFRQLLLGLDSLAACRWIELEPPSGRAWVDLSEQNLRSAHECYEQALRDVSGATVLPLDEFRSLLSAGQWPMRCLERDGRVIAIARVTWCDPAARVGEVRTIARHPDHAEPKLGRLAMAEALRQLRAAGATSACVEVASDNLLAVGLYRSFGFCDRAISEVYRMVLG